MTLRKVSTPNFLTEKLRSSSLGLGLRIRVRVFFRMCYLLKFTSECEQKGPGLLQLVTSDSGFPDGSVVKNLPANAGRTGNKSLIPGSGRDGRLQSRGPSDFHLAAETQHSPNEFNVATNQ